jgi:hypothetical protein
VGLGLHAHQIVKRLPIQQIVVLDPYQERQTVEQLHLLHQTNNTETVGFDQALQDNSLLSKMHLGQWLLQLAH